MTEPNTGYPYRGDVKICLVKGRAVWAIYMYEPKSDYFLTAYYASF